MLKRVALASLLLTLVACKSGVTAQEVPTGNGGTPISSTLTAKTTGVLTAKGVVYEGRLQVDNPDGYATEFYFTTYTDATTYHTPMGDFLMLDKTQGTFRFTPAAGVAGFGSASFHVKSPDQPAVQSNGAIQITISNPTSTTSALRVTQSGANLPFNTSQMASLDSKLYAIWTEAQDGALSPLPASVRVGVYNGNDLLPVDGGRPAGLNRNQAGSLNWGSSAASPSLVAFNSKLYAIWSESDVTSYVGSAVTYGKAQAHVSVYNGNDSAPAWAEADGGQLNRLDTSAQRTKLAVANRKLYAAFVEDGELRVLVYNGDDSAPAWTPVDGSTMTAAE